MRIKFRKTINFFRVAHHAAAVNPGVRRARMRARRPAHLTRAPRLAKNAAMILLIDNYDSFTFNLVHFLGDLGARCEVWRNDALSVEAALARAPEAIVLSPGPCTPNEAGICLDLIRAAAGRVPVLGVCLGHQAIGQAFGAEVVRAPLPMHGKLSPITHDDCDIFAGIPSPFEATRYHSLVVRQDTLPDCLVETARTGDLVMGLRHRTLPVFGVQFHPESIASQHGHAILANFLAIARGANTPARAAA
jgi:anthranilate synthase/aminodeoxychorismate synthase-like glutamine amidotransferase